MQSTRPLDRIYANMADALERDPIQGTNVNRATVPMGRGFASWRRFNPDQQLVWVDDADGHPRALTPKQAQVLAMALEMIEGAGMTMREMATALRVAPSTVSRAMTKFAAWGLVSFYVGRGRWAGLVVYRRNEGDPVGRLRKAAKARVARWSEAARRRISRLEFNVASYILEGGRGYDSLTSYALTTSTYKDATLTAQRSPAQPWTVEELRDAGII